MIRSVIAMVFLATPAMAAPAHRQPTPATVQQLTADPARPASADAKDPVGQTEQARIKARNTFMKRQEASDAKMKRTIGGICSGC